MTHNQTSDTFILTPVIDDSCHSIHAGQADSYVAMLLQLLLLLLPMHTHSKAYAYAMFVCRRIRGYVHSCTIFASIQQGKANGKT